MELSPKQGVASEAPGFNGLSNLGSASLFTLDRFEHRYMVLRSGELQLRFDEALGYGSYSPEGEQLTVTIQRGDSTIQRTETVTDYLIEPLKLHYTTGGCREPQYHYQQKKDLLFLTKGKDVYVVKSVDKEGKIYRTNNNFSFDTSLLKVGKVKFDEETSLYRTNIYRSFLEFDMDGLETNGTLTVSDLHLFTGTHQAYDANEVIDDDIYQGFKFNIAPAAGPWVDTSITWNNQPGITSPSIQGNSSHIQHIPGVFVKYGPTFDNEAPAYEHIIDIGAIVRGWLQDGSSNYGLRLSPTSFYPYSLLIAGSFYLYRKNPGRYDRNPPFLDLTIENTAQPPANRILDLGHVEAGDIIEFGYSGIEGSPVLDEAPPVPKPELQTSSAGSGTSRLKAVRTASVSLEEQQEQFTLLYEQNASFCDDKHMLKLTAQFTADNPADSVGMVVQASPSRLAPGDTAEVTPKLYFANGAIRDFPAGQTFDAEITAGAGFGSLLEADADPDDEPADELGFAEAPFYFIAGEDLQVDSAVAEITASTVLFPDGGGIIIGEAPGPELPVLERTGKAKHKTQAAATTIQSTGPPASIPLSGTGQVVIQKDSVRFTIELPDSAKVWPTLRELDGGNDNKRNIEQNIVATLTNANRPITRHTVELSAYRLKGSGGHDHELTEGGPPIEQLGKFIYEGVPSQAKLEAETDTDGKIIFDYESSVFSGEYVVRAATFWNGDSLFAKDTLTVRVPGLIPLGDSESFILSGGTCGHHGPPRVSIPVECQSPDNMHNVANSARDSLISAADEYFNGEWNTASEKIRINDISLPLGGYFDINGNWQGDHVSHRIGEDVDIEFVSNFEKLKKAFSRKGWSIIPHKTSGYFPHFRFNK